jgi:hypothetical protein
MTALQTVLLAPLVFAVLYAISRTSGYFSNLPQRTPKRERGIANEVSSHSGIKVAQFGTKFPHA